MQKQDFPGRKLKTQSEAAPNPSSPSDCKRYVRVFFALKVGIMGYASHIIIINFWNHSKTVSQFSVVLDQCSRGKEKRKPTKTMLSFVIEPFQKHRPAGEEQDNSAKHGWTAAGVFWWDSFFVMETRSHSHVRETVILIQRKYEPVGSNVGSVSFYSKNATAGGSTGISDRSEYNVKIWTFHLFPW